MILALQIVYAWGLLLMTSASMRAVPWVPVIHPPDRVALMTIVCGRFSLDLVPFVAWWGFDWNTRGYDGYWYTWGLYPLLEFTALDPSLFDPREGPP